MNERRQIVRATDSRRRGGLGTLVREESMLWVDRAGPPGPRAGAGAGADLAPGAEGAEGQGAFESTMRQRPRIGQRSCFGLRAWHSSRP